MYYKGMFTHSIVETQCVDECFGDVRRQTVDDGLSTRDERHSGRHEAHHVQRCQVDALLFRIKREILVKNQKYSYIFLECT